MGLQWEIIIVNKDVEHYADLLKEGIGSCIKFRGEIVKSLEEKQPIEMKVEKNDAHYVKIMGTCDQGKYPLMVEKEQKKWKWKLKRNLPFKAYN